MDISTSKVTMRKPRSGTLYEQYMTKLFGGLPADWPTAQAGLLLYEHFMLNMTKSVAKVSEAQDTVHHFRLGRGLPEITVGEFWGRLPQPISNEMLRQHKIERSDTVADFEAF